MKCLRQTLGVLVELGEGLESGWPNDATLLEWKQNVKIVEVRSAETEVNYINT